MCLWQLQRVLCSTGISKKQTWKDLNIPHPSVWFQQRAGMEWNGNEGSLPRYSSNLLFSWEVGLDSQRRDCAWKYPSDVSKTNKLRCKGKSGRRLPGLQRLISVVMPHRSCSCVSWLHYEPQQASAWLLGSAASPGCVSGLGGRPGCPRKVMEYVVVQRQRARLMGRNYPN